MEHKAWHEWLVSIDRHGLKAEEDDTRSIESFYKCFCGHQWKVTKSYDVEGFFKSKIRKDKPQTGK